MRNIAFLVLTFCSNTILGFHKMSSSIKGCHPLKIIKGCIFSKVILHQRSCCIKCHLSPNVFFHWRSTFTEVVLRESCSSIKADSPSNVVSHQRLHFIKVVLPSKVAFHQKLASIKGSLPSNFRLPSRGMSLCAWLYVTKELYTGQ